MTEKMTFEEYEKRPGINASLLKIAHSKSMLHVKMAMDGVKKQSESMGFGTLFHSLALEGREDFVINPETYTNEKGERKPWHASSTTCKKWKEDQGGKQVVSKETSLNLRGMAFRVKQALGQIDSEKSELSFFVKKDGIQLKARIDLLNQDAVIDLKSCSSAKPEKFMLDAINFGYHMQAAFYLDVLKLAGIDRNEFWFIAVESEPPYAVSTIKMKDEPIGILRLGRIHYREALKKVVESTKTGSWGDYGAVNADDFIPRWLMPEIERTA